MSGLVFMGVLASAQDAIDRAKRGLKAAGLAMCVAAPLALAGCVDDAGAKSAATAFGFTNVTTFKPSWFYNGCSDKDTYATGIYATNPQGARIKGVVCAGGWGGKASTVRIDEVIAPAPVQPVASDVPLAQ